MNACRSDPDNGKRRGGFSQIKVAVNCFAQNTRSNLWNKLSLVIWGISISLIYLFIRLWNENAKPWTKFYFGFVINKRQNTPHMHKNYRFKANENNIWECSGGMKTFQHRGGALISMVFAHNVQWKNFLVKIIFNIFFQVC